QRRKRQGVRFTTKQIFNELFEKKTTTSRVRRTIQIQLPIIFGEHRVAGWLEENNWQPGIALVNERKVVRALTGRRSEIALTKSRTSTTRSPFDEPHAESSGFEHPYRGLPDMRFVVAHERIVPKDNLTAGSIRPRRALPEPMIECFAGKWRQRTPRREAKNSPQQFTDRRGLNRRVSKGRRHAAKPAQQIDPT